jgi:hypothetical protein
VEAVRDVLDAQVVPIGVETLVSTHVAETVREAAKTLVRITVFILLIKSCKSSNK